MNKSSFLLTASLYFSISAFAVNIDYELSMSHPNSHYFEVEIDVTDLKDEELVIKMPIWAPGSYLVREFAKSVNLVKAFDGEGKTLEVSKRNKNTWVIPTKEIRQVTIKYEVYAFVLSVRTSFLDDSHGYLNGTSVFMYVENKKDIPGTLKINLHKSFKKISTSLKKKSGTTYSFLDYDQLVDSPIEIGNQEEFTFDAAGVKHTVAMYGEGNYDVLTLQKDMAKIVEAETKVFGQNPNKEYLFIVHNLTNPSGGLEHKSSTTLEVNRWTYDEDNYMGFLSLVAHEYFHLWNVKRMRPKSLGPFDYDNENYTDLLWVMEGFTSYYDELILRRAGYYTEEDYLNKIIRTINYVENQPGNKVQAVAHASFDAWIKAYRHTENSANIGISYYSKGHILAVMLDLYIINKYNARKSLDDFLQKLWADFYGKNGSGFTEEEFQVCLEEFLGEGMDWFFKPYVYGTETIAYKKFFAGVGLNFLRTREKLKPYLGVRTSDQNGKLIVNNVIAGSAAEAQGISVHDEIIAFNGHRVNNITFNSMLERTEVGEEVELMISRDNIMKSYEIIIGVRNNQRYEYDPAFNDQSKKNFDYWLRVDVK